MLIRSWTFAVLATLFQVLASFGTASDAVAMSEACQRYEAEVAAGKPIRRIALSIGTNDRAQGINNATNDSVLIATTLRGLGWDVTQLSDVNQQAMLAALQALRCKVSALCPSDLVLFYFAGNGLEVNRVSYFGGTDAATDRLANPRFEGAKFIVLDTCRDIHSKPWRQIWTNSLRLGCRATRSLRMHQNHWTTRQTMDLTTATMVHMRGPCRASSCRSTRPRKSCFEASGRK
jgi:hypothetical protein